MANKKASLFDIKTTILNTDLFPFVRPTDAPSLRNSIIDGTNLKSNIQYATVNAYADLPAPATTSGQIWVVLTSTGIYLINRKEAGMYYSDGASWTRLGNIPAYFSDINFEVYDGLDTTKRIGFEVGNITTGTKRTITFPDTDLDLGDITLNTAKRHDAVTVLDTFEIDLSLTGQQISASIVAGSIDETKLDTSVNISLDLADTSIQPNDPLSDLDTNVTGAQLDAIKTKTDFITVTQAVNLDTMETDVSASKTKTDFISITQAVNLDTIESDTTLNNTHRTSSGVDHTFINQDVKTSASPSFTALTVSAGNITQNQTGATVSYSIISATDNSADLILTNTALTSTTRIRKNAGNGDTLFQNNAVNVMTFGGNITSGTGITINQADIIFNTNNVDRDAIFEGTTDARLLVIDAGSNNVGVGVVGVPVEKLDVLGNINSSGYTSMATIADPSLASTGFARSFNQDLAGRALSKNRYSLGLSEYVQSAFHGTNVFYISHANGTGTPLVIGGSTSQLGTLSRNQVFTSASLWTQKERKTYTSGAIAGNQAGTRTAYTKWYRGNATGMGGFFFRGSIGNNINLNGSQAFMGLCATTAALGAGAGAMSALLNMAGLGYDTTDSSAGNWFFVRNDGAGTATKVDTGVSRATTNGLELTMYLPPNNGTLYVTVANITAGTVVLNTNYNTDIIAVNTGLAFKMECNNGAVASASAIDTGTIYINTEF